MKKKINIPIDFESKIFLNYFQSSLGKNVINFNIQDTKIFDHQKMNKILGNEFVIYISQIEKVFFEFDKFNKTGVINIKKLDKEILIFTKIIKFYSENNKKLIFFLWPLDTFDNYLGGLNSKQNGKSWIINYINLNVSKNLSKLSNINIIDPNFELLRKKNKFNLFDNKLKYLIECIYSHDYLNFLSDISLKNLNILNSNNQIKIIIIDLDNTIWGGLAGETNYKSLKIGPNSIEGVIYSDFQERLKILQSKGIVLAIVSKNDKKNVKRVFDRNKYMKLKLKDFSAIKINWEPKDKNISTLLNELNLKPHHALFIDDTPYEREVVKKNVKEINIFNFPENIFDLVYELNNFPGIFRNSISNTDKVRTIMYQQENKRIAEKNRYNDDIKWLKSLKIRLKVSKLNDFDRATEMFQRTNQFNISFKRYEKSDLIKLTKKNLVLQVSMQDKFGDYGIISLINIKVQENYYVIEDFLMSCRVFKRRIEEAIFYFLENQKNLTKKTGILKIVRNSRNKYAQDLFQSIKFLNPKNKNEFKIEKSVKNINYKNLGIKITTNV